MTLFPVDASAAGAIRRSGMREDVYDELLAMLLDGRFAAGSALRVVQIAAGLKVSQTPVREAMAALEATGLVTYVPHKGYRVAPGLSADEMREIMDARAMLESAAASRATAVADADLVPELTAALDAQRAAAATLDLHEPAGIRAYLECDRAFHDTIFAHCGNDYIRSMAATINAQSHRARQSLLQGVDDASDAIAEHELVLHAIRAGDATAAAAAMEAHIRAVARRAVVDADADAP